MQVPLKKTLQTVTLSSRCNELSIRMGFRDLDPAFAVGYGEAGYFFVAVNVPFTIPAISIFPFMVFFSTVPS